MPKGSQTASSREATAAELRSLARTIIDGAAPVRLALAETREDRQACFRLRAETILARGWREPGEVPGIDRDLDDERAIHILATLDGMAVGAARLVLPSPEVRLPVERAFGITIEPRGRVAEVGRFAVARDLQQPYHRTYAALALRCWLAAEPHGITHGCSSATTPAIRLMRMIGMQTEVIGSARAHWGAPRFLVRMDVLGSLPSMGAAFRKRESLAAAAPDHASTLPSTPRAGRG